MLTRYILNAHQKTIEKKKKVENLLGGERTHPALIVLLRSSGGVGEIPIDFNFSPLHYTNFIYDASKNDIK